MHLSLKPETLQHRAIRAASLGMFLDGFDLSIIAIALLPLHTAWRIGSGVIGVLLAAALLGSLVGGMVGGALIDRYGRRLLLFSNVLLYIVGALASAASANWYELAIARFIIGLGVGMDYPLVATVVAEYSNDSQRGNRFAWVNIAWYGGALAASCVGLSLLPLGPWSWRIMLGIAALPALYLLWLRQHIPESPRWLSRSGQYPAANVALKRLHPTWTSQHIQSTVKAYGGRVRHWTVLLRPLWRNRLLLSTLPWFCLDVVGLGIALYFPLVLRSEGLASNNMMAAAINVVFLLISVAGIILILPRIDRFGRIPLQIAGFTLMALGLWLFAGALVEKSWLVVYIGCAIYAFGVGVGPGVTVIALAVEIFPTELRASAGGFATAVSRLGAALSALVFPIINVDWGLPIVLVLMGIVSVIGAGVTFHYAVEPTQKSLESLES
jgi:putative MFS transporter